MGMISVALGRLSQAFLLLIVMSLIGFIGIHSVGNPVFNVVQHRTATPEDIRQATIALGLDQPIWRQYLVFIDNVVSGNSAPPTSIICGLRAGYGQAAGNAGTRVCRHAYSAPLGTGLASLAGRRSGTLFDRTLLKASVSALSIPASGWR